MRQRTQRCPRKPFRALPLTVRNRIEKVKGVVVSQLMSYDTADSGRRPHDSWHRVKGRRRTDPIPGANSSSRVELLRHGPSPRGSQGPVVGLFRLTPLTGKTHQLRIHMAMLGLGILHDRFYPDLWDDAPDDFEAPLQLLARSKLHRSAIRRTPRLHLDT